MVQVVWMRAEPKGGNLDEGYDARRDVSAGPLASVTPLADEIPMIPEEELTGAQPQNPRSFEIGRIAAAITSAPAASMPAGELSSAQIDELDAYGYGLEQFTGAELAAGQAEAKRLRQAKIDKRRQEEAARKSAEESERTMRVQERAANEQMREEALARAAEARRQRVLARRNIYAPTPPAGSQPPPAGSPTPGGPAATPPGPRQAPPPAAMRGPMTAPSPSSVATAPAMVPVRTLEGDLRKQNVGGKDVAVPLVELTDTGAFVPNASALTVEDFTSAYTVQDARSVADMIRTSGDPRAKQEQMRIDNDARRIAADGRLTPEERKAANDELIRRQAALHHGFLQSQGAGMGVRAGLGDVNPNAPAMEQVFSLMEQLQRRYPNADPKTLYEMAVSMAMESGSTARPNGTVPYSVGLMGQAAAGERAASEAETARQQKAAVAKQALELQSKGWDVSDASEYLTAAQGGDMATASKIFKRHELKQELSKFRESMRPIPDSEIDRNIQTEVLSRDAVYSTKAKRLVLLQQAQAGDEKAQKELGLYPEDTEKWSSTFGEGGEMSRLDSEVRKALSDAMSNQDNRRKAEERIREKSGFSKPKSINDRNGQLLAMAVILDLRNRIDQKSSNAAVREEVNRLRQEDKELEGTSLWLLARIAQGWKVFYTNDQAELDEDNITLKALEPMASLLGIELPHGVINPPKK